MTPYLLCLLILVEFFDATSHVCFKRGVNQVESSHLKTLAGYRGFVRRVFAHPATWVGFACVACGLVLWCAVLARMDLSRAFPFGAIQYLFILGASSAFLGERLDWPRVVGTGCIVLGVVVVALN